MVGAAAGQVFSARLSGWLHPFAVLLPATLNRMSKSSAGLGNEKNSVSWSDFLPYLPFPRVSHSIFFFSDEIDGFHITYL